MKILKQIFIQVLIISIFLCFGCKRSVFEQDQNPEYQTNLQMGQKITLEIQQDTEAMLYPENGQTGGIGKNTEGKVFRAYLSRNTRTGFWDANVSLYDGIFSRPIVDAQITINCRLNQSQYLSFTLKQWGRSSEYYLSNINAPFKNGKRTGYFHVVHSSGLDFKLGFGIQKLDLTQIEVNGVSTNGNIQFARIQAGGNINISATCKDGVYYELSLSGNTTTGYNERTWRCYNYYSPTGKITINSIVTSKYATGKHGVLFIGAHSVYIAKGFHVTRYPDGTQQVSMVSVRDGNKLAIGILTKFY